MSAATNNLNHNLQVMYPQLFKPMKKLELLAQPIRTNRLIINDSLSLNQHLLNQN